MIMKPRVFRNLCFYLIIAALTLFPAALPADDSTAPLSLKETIEQAIAANLKLKQSQEEVKAAEEVRKESITRFLPTFSSSYDYLHRNKELTQSLTGLGTGPEFVVRPDDQYTFVTSFTQPIFRGFELINQYKISDLGLNSAELSQKITRQDVILDAQNAYYSVLKTQKLLGVAEQRVIQIASQKEVAENFYEVGMSPLNDLLQAQASLANARQGLIAAQNNLEIAKSQFNIVLRRPVNSPVAIEDILDYKPLVQNIDYYLSSARDNRLEIKVADLQVQIAEKEVMLARKDYYPSINLTGQYMRTGDQYDVNGGEGISDAAGWQIEATAQWDFGCHRPNTAARKSWTTLNWKSRRRFCAPKRPKKILPLSKRPSSRPRKTFVSTRSASKSRSPPPPMSSMHRPCCRIR
jgi:outer membrane protein